MGKPRRKITVGGVEYKLNKKKLLGLLSTELEYSPKTVEWFSKRYTAEQLRSVVENHRTLIVIARVAAN